MDVQPNILFTVHEGAPFVGHDACAHNLLLEKRPFIMRFRQLTLLAAKTTLQRLSRPLWATGTTAY